MNYMIVYFFVALIFILPVGFVFGDFRRIRIIVPDNSLGLKIDAELYLGAIKNSYVVYVDWKSPRRHLAYYRFSKNNIYIERSQVGKGFPAINNFLVPNPEFFNVIGALPDTFLCKTRHAERVLSGLGKVVYVGHTSIDNDNYRYEKNDDLIVLFAGKSWLKNADKAIEAWMRNPDFPHLVVTANKKIGVDFFDKNILPKNLTVYEKLSEEQLNLYARSAGAFLCPSSIEGFGHYLNEGRAAGALVITTDFPPMNELIDEDSGILISPMSIVEASTLVDRNDFGFEYNEAFELNAATISVESIELSIRRYMAMPRAEKQLRRVAARNRYLAEREAWRVRLLDVLGR